MGILNSSLDLVPSSCSQEFWELWRCSSSPGLFPVTMNFCVITKQKKQLGTSCCDTPSQSLFRRRKSKNGGHLNSGPDQN